MEMGRRAVAMLVSGLIAIWGSIVLKAVYIDPLPSGDTLGATLMAMFPSLIHVIPLYANMVSWFHVGKKIEATVGRLESLDKKIEGHLGKIDQLDERIAGSNADRKLNEERWKVIKQFIEESGGTVPDGLDAPELPSAGKDVSSG